MMIPSSIQYASLGPADSLILIVMALVVFGPRRLPQIGRQIGKLMYEFRKASNDFKYQMEEELRCAEEADRLKKQEERLKELGVVIPGQAGSTSQVSESGPDVPTSATEPPVTIASLVAEAEAKSPYVGEEQYPSIPSIDPEAHAESGPLQIHPPSTGEVIAAARPGTLAAQVQANSEAIPETSKAAEEPVSIDALATVIPESEPAHD